MAPGLLVHQAAKDRLKVPPPDKPVNLYALGILMLTSHLSTDGGRPFGRPNELSLVQAWSFEN